VLRIGLWTIVAVCTAAYALTLLVPLWFQVHGQRLLIVTSGSMAPQFDAGDAVVMQKIDNPSQLKVDQIASFWPPGSKTLVTHRIIGLKMLPVLKPDKSTGRAVPELDPTTGQGIERPYIFTKGDANAYPDPDATPLSQVRGVILRVHPGWGYVLAWAHSPQGRMIMLAPPLAVLAGLELAALYGARQSLVERRLDRERSDVDDLLLD
jgi:signal peptidase I